MTSESAPHVLIIGAGLGGLCLAQGLKKHNVSFSVYESDALSHSRGQGYRIRVNHDGATALRTNLPEDLWHLFERTCPTIEPGGTRINAVDGAVVTATKQGGLTRKDIPRGADGVRNLGPYTVDRSTLRDVLLMGLESHVHFDHRLESYSIENGRVTAHFSHGLPATGTLLVGAEGLHSPVRHQYVPGREVLDTDGRAIYGKTIITPELEASFLPDAMQNMTVISDSTPLTLFLEPIRFPNDNSIESQGQLARIPNYVYWVLAARSHVFKLPDAELLKLCGNDAKQLSLDMTTHWAESIRALLKLQDVAQTRMLRLSSARPEMEAWAPSKHVTLLGDAIHVMPPTGGVGANSALGDAMDLCKTIVEDGISEESVGKYEERLREYARKAIAGSSVGGASLYGQPPLSECKVIENM